MNATWKRSFFGSAVALFAACSADKPVSPSGSDGQPPSPPSVLTVLCSSKGASTHPDDKGTTLADCSADGTLIASTRLTCNRGAISSTVLPGQKATAFCDEGVPSPARAPEIPAPSPQRPSSLTFLCSTRDATAKVDYETGQLTIRCPAEGPLESITALACKKGALSTWIEGDERVSVRCVDQPDPRQSTTVFTCPRGKAKTRMTGERGAAIYCDEG